MIVQKRGGEGSNESSLLSFQSFAFAPAGKDSAQVAFLNAVSGSDSDTRLRVADAAVGGGGSRRAEELMLNRVYAIEEGNMEVLGFKLIFSHLIFAG